MCKASEDADVVVESGFLFHLSTRKALSVSGWALVHDASQKSLFRVLS